MIGGEGGGVPGEDLFVYFQRGLSSVYSFCFQSQTNTHTHSLNVVCPLVTLRKVPGEGLFVLSDTHTHTHSGTPTGVAGVGLSVFDHTYSCLSWCRLSPGEQSQGKTCLS